MKQGNTAGLSESVFSHAVRQQGMRDGMSDNVAQYRSYPATGTGCETRNASLRKKGVAAALFSCAAWFPTGKP